MNIRRRSFLVLFAVACAALVVAVGVWAVAPRNARVLRTPLNFASSEEALRWLGARDGREVSSEDVADIERVLKAEVKTISGLPDDLWTYTQAMLVTSVLYELKRIPGSEEVIASTVRGLLNVSASSARRIALRRSNGLIGDEAWFLSQLARMAADDPVDDIRAESAQYLRERVLGKRVETLATASEALRKLRAGESVSVEELRTLIGEFK